MKSIFSQKVEELIRSVYDQFVVESRGTLELTTGQHRVFIHTCGAPLKVWVRFGAGGIGTCANSTEVDFVNVEEQATGFTLTANIVSNSRVIEWFVD